MNSRILQRALNIIYVHTYIHTYTLTHGSCEELSYTYYVHIHMLMYICTYIHTYIHTHELTDLAKSCLQHFLTNLNWTLPCVCMYVCMYVDMCICMRVCMYSYIGTCVQICMHACICVCVDPRRFIPGKVRICIHTAYAYMSVCMYVYVCVYVYCEKPEYANILHMHI